MASDQPRGVEWEFGATDPSSCPSRLRMPLFKKSKKPRQPRQQPASSGIPTHIVVKPLGISADLAPDNSPEGAFRSVTDGADLTTVAGVDDGRGSRVVLRDGSVDRRLDPSSPSTSIPGREDGITSGYILPQPRPILMILMVLHE